MSVCVAQELEWLSDERSRAFELSIIISLKAVTAVHDFYAGSPPWRPAGFPSYAGAVLARSSGVQAPQWVPRVAAAQRETFE